jgi:Ca2+-dependent lipid-binding protein
VSAENSLQTFNKTGNNITKLNFKESQKRSQAWKYPNSSSSPSILNTQSPVIMTSNKLSDILITFKSASHIPIGDALAQSSDPYVLACLTPRVPPSPEHPPFPLTYRSTTKRSTRNPEWNETWHLGGIPAEGFNLKIKIYDEDKPGDFDDRLGVAELLVRELPPASSDGKPGQEHEHELKLQKKKASKRVYVLTYLVAWCHADFKKQRGRVSPHINLLI